MKTKMIPTLLLGLLALAVARPVEAQDQQRRMGMGPNLDRQLAELTEVLALDEKQVVEVREVLETQAEKRRETMRGMRRGGDRQAMMGAMRKLQEETRAMLAEVLDEEQLEKYDAHVREMRQRRRPPPF